MDAISLLKNLLLLCGGLAFFLYGMHVLSDGLEKLAGGKMQSILGKITNNRLKGLMVGTVVTAVIQSSSATTVMLVGLVNSGLMTLTQSIGVIMGSNIGTTVTAWLTALNGIDSKGWEQFLKPEQFCMLIALIGAFMLLFSKNEKRRNVGVICVGFSVLMYGMSMMSSAMKPISDEAWFQEALTVFNNPLLGVLIGTVFTALIQSSSASVGVLQALTLSGSGLTFHAAVPIILGQNIGTCISALMAIPGTSKNAKRVAIVHVLIKVIGVALWLVLWMLADLLFDLSFMENTISPVGVAMAHTIFNILNTFTLLPFVSLLEKLSKLIVRGEDQDALPEVVLDERLFTMPALAVGKAYNFTVEMADIAKNTVSDALGLFTEYNPVQVGEVNRHEKTLDMYEDKLGSYLVSLSRCDMGEAEARTSAMLLHIISDFERIGDHAYNLTQTAGEMMSKKIAFSSEAKRELETLTAALTEILDITVRALHDKDPELAYHVEPLEQVIDSLIETIRDRHIARLQRGNCTIELGFILTDLLNDYERISDHCSNIGIAIIETARDAFETHAHLQSIKHHPSEDFRQDYAEFSRRFSLTSDI